MSTPTFKLPPGYATVSWSIPAFTEGATAIGVAVLKSISYRNQLELLPVEGNTGFVAGFTIMRRSDGGPPPTNGAGGTKFDTEQVSMALVGGTLTGLSWPDPGTVITVSGAAGQFVKFNGDWSIVAENDSFARKQEAEKGYDLERYCDVDLTP